MDEGRFRTLFAVLNEPILLVSAEARVTGFNDAAVSLFGTARRLYGRQIQLLMPFVMPPPALAEGPHNWRGRAVTADGVERDLEVGLTHVPLVDGQALMAYIVHDISQLAEAIRLREQLLFTAAHELRGPVSILDTTLDILAGEPDTLGRAEAAEMLARAHRTARRLRLLVEHVLSAGTIRSGRFVVTPEPTELQLVVEHALDAVGPILRGRGQRVELDLGSDEPTVQADRVYAPQILANLLINASNYSPQRTTIHVRARLEAQMLRVDVEDHGPGIPAEQQVGLFEPYVRANSGDLPAGFGLGLAIARDIVEAHAGRIGLESHLGAGTRVWFTLPLTLTEA